MLQFVISIIASGSGLIVRRGSEPALANIGAVEEPKKQEDSTLRPGHKRWSSIPSVDAKHGGVRDVVVLRLKSNVFV